MIRWKHTMLVLLTILAMGAGPCAAAAPDAGVSLEGCVILTPPKAPAPVAKAAETLGDEMAKRTGLDFQVKSEAPAGVPVIALGIADDMPAGISKPPAGLSIPDAPEGYAVWADASGKAPAVCIAGRDARGALFGVGRLLRALDMTKGAVTLDPGFRDASAPRYPVRGHELGFRNKSNTYDAWSVEQFEQYFRDMAVFGANTVQLLAELNHMDQEGPHMTEPAAERMTKLTRLAGSYGLRTWIWLPPGDKAFKPETRDEILATCRSLFQQWSPIDAVFVPGGDPGDAHPKDLLPWVRDMAAVLREFHPNAEVWISNEDIPHEGNAYLFDYLEREQPDWLTGMVFGTWVKHSLEAMRAKVPAKYPIVQYCDITHSIECQYPVPDWDAAFAITLGREGINPRPIGTAHIHNAMAPYAIGFNTYSDGVNDDVNKIVWTARGWDPDADITQVLTEYGQYFVREDLGEHIAKGLLALERNWQGPLLKNDGVEKTLALWQGIEKQAGDAPDTNWRLQMALYRANYDAYVRGRLIAETEREQEALAALEAAPDKGAAAAIEQAKAILAGADAEPGDPELRARIEELAAGLFKTIGMQLSVEKYGANNWERGATLDAVDNPLNNRLWLEAQFAEILALPDEPARLSRIETIVNWENPGPGGFYDDLGNATKQPHLVRQKEWADDPGFVESPQGEFIEFEGRETWRISWLNQGQTLFGTPLLMRYEGLDAGAAYTLRVVYTGRFRPTMRLVANGKHEIHGELAQPQAPEVLEFPIPKEATASGTLDLEWQHVPGAGRGCQVGEVWLVRTK